MKAKLINRFPLLVKRLGSAHFVLVTRAPQSRSVEVCFTPVLPRRTDGVIMFQRGELAVDSPNLTDWLPMKKGSDGPVLHVKGFNHINRLQGRKGDFIHDDGID